MEKIMKVYLRIVYLATILMFMVASIHFSANGQDGIIVIFYTVPNVVLLVLLGSLLEQEFLGVGPERLRDI